MTAASASAEPSLASTATQLVTSSSSSSPGGAPRRHPPAAAASSPHDTLPPSSPRRGASSSSSYPVPQLASSAPASPSSPSSSSSTRIHALPNSSSTTTTTTQPQSQPQMLQSMASTRSASFPLADASSNPEPSNAKAKSSNRNNSRSRSTRRSQSRGRNNPRAADQSHVPAAAAAPEQAEPPSPTKTQQMPQPQPAGGGGSALARGWASLRRQTGSALPTSTNATSPPAPQRQGILKFNGSRRSVPPPQEASVPSSPLVDADINARSSSVQLERQLSDSRNRSSLQLERTHTTSPVPSPSATAPFWGRGGGGMAGAPPSVANSSALRQHFQQQMQMQDQKKGAPVATSAPLQIATGVVGEDLVLASPAGWADSPPFNGPHRKSISSAHSPRRTSSPSPNVADSYFPSPNSAGYADRPFSASPPPPLTRNRTTGHQGSGSRQNRRPSVGGGGGNWNNSNGGGGAWQGGGSNRGSPASSPVPPNMDRSQRRPSFPDGWKAASPSPQEFAGPRSPNAPRSQYGWTGSGPAAPSVSTSSSVKPLAVDIQDRGWTPNSPSRSPSWGRSPSLPTSSWPANPPISSSIPASIKRHPSNRAGTPKTGENAAGEWPVSNSWGMNGGPSLPNSWRQSNGGGWGDSNAGTDAAGGNSWAPSPTPPLLAGAAGVGAWDGERPQSTSVTASPERPPLEFVADGRWRVGEKLGEGSFGEVLAAVEVATGKHAAVKRELKDVSRPQLEHEYKVYQLLSGAEGFPRVYYYGVEGDYNVLVMERLGPSLKMQQRNSPTHRIPLKTVVWMVPQLVKRLQTVHEKGMVFRDVKPDQFCVGRFGADIADRPTIFLVDFGLATTFLDPDGKHIRPTPKPAPTDGEPGERPPTQQRRRQNRHGTLRGRTHARRDDIESLAYVLLDLARGSLPWTRLRGVTHAISSAQGWRKIGIEKDDCVVAELCAGLPEAFARLLEYSRELKFNERPDYAWITGMFVEVLVRLEAEEEADEESAAAAGLSASASAGGRKLVWTEGGDGGYV
ncbi:hypothetical protein DFJ73DRAFT_921093 [Zopfochytrium polystomum]|nr:hypothetical protein DFJ73DRAFT_921093 [Zopfochytrium polystomum]